MKPMSSRAAVVLSVLGAVVACSSSPTKSTTPCKPKLTVLCKCQDGSEGQQTCEDDGSKFSPCDPCIPPDPLPDAGVDPIDAADSGPPGCGDGIVQEPEQCDDKNKTSGDGCSAKCVLDGNPDSARACPGMQVHVWDSVVEYSGTTTVYAQTFRASPSCGVDGGATSSGSTSPDRVFKVTPHRPGTLKVETLNATFDTMIYAAETCAPDLVHKGWCANAKAGNAGEVLTFPVSSEIAYFVVVDGGAITVQGNFTIRFSVF